MRDAILALNHLTVRFDVSEPWIVRAATGRARRTLRAVEDVSLEVDGGTTFAIVGESGCGKSTIARTVAGIQRPTSGTVSFMGADIGALRTRHARLPFRRNMQMVFQDPYASLNPRWRAGRIVAEPIVTHRLLVGRVAIDRRVSELFLLVGLAASDVNKFPHQFSGGQRQRIAIARALASDAQFIVCDEPTSALDVSVQAQILNLMRDLQRRLGLSYLLISHNLAVVAQMADRLGVMYLGRIVEQGDADEILANPRHPYTRLLLDTVPDVARPRRLRAPGLGETPSAITPPTGCTFHPRCPHTNDRCRTDVPVPLVRAGVAVACHAVEENRMPPKAIGSVPQAASA